MRNTFIILSLIFCYTWLFAQSVGFNEINGNQIKTGMHSNGSLFFDMDFNEANFIVPYESGQIDRATIYASGIWLGGVDPVGNLYTSYITYPNGFSEQYSSGPSNVAELNTSFARVWKVNRSEIEAHISDFQDGTIDDPLADNIEQWPARGNTYYMPALPSDQLLAPFFDADANGYYNPDMGDYPIIGEDLIDVIPEEMLYTVFNANHASLASPPNVEIHALMYAFNCEQDEVMQNTVFTRHRIINTGNEPYQNFRFAFWQDADLGCHTDDYLGCDSTLNAFFTYNADPIDGDTQGFCNGGIATYNDNPPVQSTVFLNQKMENFLITYNPGVGFPAPGTTDPENDFEHYQTMNGNFRDGLPITIGGNGYNPGSEEVTNYVYHDDPGDPNGWSMAALSVATGDPRAIASSGVETFLPGQIYNLDLAHIYTSELMSDNIETVTDAKVDIQSIQSLYEEKFEGTCAILSNTSELEFTHINVYPNPARSSFYISQTGEFNEYLLVDGLGRIIDTGTLAKDLTEIKTHGITGVYFLQMKNQRTGQQHRQTIILE